jgi:hypothetical protein
VLATCPACGGLARPVALERVAPEGEDLAELVRRPFSGEGLGAVVAMAIPYAFVGFPMPFLGRLALFIYGGVLASYYFQIINHVGLGRPGMPFSADVGSRSELSSAVGRGLACFAVAFGPAWAVSFFMPNRVALLAAFALGIALVPASVLAIAITQNALSGLWPPTMARIIARAPGAYAQLVGVFAVSSGVWWLGYTLANATLGRIPVVGDLGVGIVINVLALLQAVLVGGFLRRNAAEFGYD